MGDNKSKFPDLKELGEIAGKLMNDLKRSVTEIMGSYKKNHGGTQSAPKTHAHTAAPKAQTAAPKKTTAAGSTGTVKKTTAAKPKKTTAKTTTKK